ncbi:uncharacterized protein B0T15DRAFT_574142 [Chaetomium strumarium]|uniref:Mid2 domain-containing protein n=1 Tax=Chaetomium strumarium TaxID=1170767 RepID=A0AAJ0M372_9PEZI|nr:hypothetical protein B0T15DRAFT_574142 [Chaetomium strumarium]
MRTDFFECLPRPTALLLLSSLLELTSAYALFKVPRQTPAPTITIPYRPLNVVSWPIQPTPPPGNRFALHRRQGNTVCGYIGGDSALPATCGAGSHCVLDTEHNVVGCCPDGAPSCTAGVFTGCVDGNSGPQTEVNPYVYSCTGGNVCYKNVFEGGFSQFGCGTASDLAATVMNSASGITTALTRPTVSVSYTQSISTLSEPTTLGTITSKSISSESSTSSSSSATSSSLSTSTVVANSAATSSSAAAASTDSGPRTGAIVGGTIGGLAVLIALVALAFFFLRRRNANVRQGPGPGGVRGKHISSPMGIGGTGFSALAQDHDAFETGPGPAAAGAYNHPPEMTTTTTAYAGAGPASPPPAALAHRSMLPPITTGPPIATQMEVSPVNDDPLDPDNDRSPFAYAGAVSAGAASISSYPPSSSGGITTASNAVSDAPAGGLYYPGQYPAYPAAYAGGSGLMMGMNPLLVPANGQRQLESDQVPLTREIDDFSQGFHAALGRIGEEDEEEGQETPYKDHVASSGAGQGQQQQEGAVGGQGGGDHGGGTHDSSGSATSALSKPLWQQNRRQSRNLMWM